MVSLFSGALGLDLGVERAGFRIAVAVEANPTAAATIKRNRPEIPVIQRPIEKVTTAEILETAGVRPGEVAVVSGGPSCQAFSTVGQRASLGDPRGILFREFLRVVREAQPHYFVMENVRGVLSAAIHHRPLAQRGPMFPQLQPDEELGSAFAMIVSELAALDYFTLFDLLNAADFGVAQTRERVVFLGSRDGKPLTMPTRTHSKDGKGNTRRWRTLRQVLRGLHEREPVFSALSAFKAEILSHVPEGGNWRDLPEDLQRIALGRAYDSWGGRAGFFRRLAWHRPSPALTTRPDSKATMSCHPTELRPLTVRECARLQQFPNDWVFSGSAAQVYTQVGNAVPVGLAFAIGEALLLAHGGHVDPSKRGVVAAADPALVQRLASRPKTVVNPARMRGDEGENDLRAWLGSSSKRKLPEALMASPESATSP